MRSSSPLRFRNLGLGGEARVKEEEIWPDPVVTEIVAVNNYYDAEDYHQDYFKNNPQNQYCSMVVAPKLAKFKKTFASRLRSDA